MVTHTTVDVDQCLTVDKMEPIHLYSGSNLREVGSILNKDFPGCGSKIVLKMLEYIPVENRSSIEFTIHKEGDKYRIYIHYSSGPESNLALWSDLYRSKTDGKEVAAVDKLDGIVHEGRDLEREKIIEIPIGEE